MDYSQREPVSDEQFEVFRRLYAYDPSPLNDKVDAVSEESELWRREIVSLDVPYGNERLPVHILLPKNVSPPFQVVLVFPGVDALFSQSSQRIDYGYSGFYTRFLVRTGRVVVHPIYSGSYERAEDGGRPLRSKHTNAWADRTVRWYQELARTLDYLETRADIDRERLAYFGLSLGGEMGSIFLALDSRFRAAVLCYGGLSPLPVFPEADAFNFAPRVKVPILMINGSDDYFFPKRTSQDPLWESLGTGPDLKQRVVVPGGGHSVSQTKVIKETLDWLDEQLGPVGSQEPLSASQ